MPGPAEALLLAELIAARTSHDLSGVIGTLAGALELAVEEADSHDEAVTLAADAAGELRQRLRLLRAAWGPAASPLGLDELRALTDGLPAARRVAVDLSGLAADTVFPPATARIVLNLLMLAGESLPARGEVALAGTPADLVFSIAGPRAAWPAGFASCLTSETAAWAAVTDARTLLAPYTALLARALGLRLSLLFPGGDALPKLRLSEI